MCALEDLQVVIPYADLARGLQAAPSDPAAKRAQDAIATARADCHT
jgi:hypothetical protein